MLTVALLARIVVAVGFLYVLVRLSGKRGLSGVHTFDLIVAVLLGNLAGMTVLGQAPLAAGLLAMGALVWLCVLMGVLTCRLPRLRRRLWGATDTLVQHGHVRLSALQRRQLSSADLGTLLREAGVERLGDVQLLRLEPDGTVSVRWRPDAQPLTPRDLPQTSTPQEGERWPRAA